MRRTSFNAEAAGPPARLAWSKNVIDAELNPVVLERGRVVVSGRTRFAGTGPIRALWTDDGTEIWSHDFGNVESVGQPTLVDGRVYVQHQKGIDLPDAASLYCLDVASGDVIWNTDFNSQWEHYWSPAVSANMVYVNGGTYGGLYGFDRDDGERLFFNDRLEQYDEWSPTLLDDGVLTMTEGNLRQHHLTAGTIDWSVSFTWDWRGWSMGTVVPEHDGVVYVIASPTLYALRLLDREVLWKRTSAFYSYPAVSEDHVYALDQQSLVAFARDSGEALFSVELGGSSSYPPIATAGHVWVADADTVRAIEIATGEEVWRDTRGGWLSVGGDMLFVAGADGVLSAYELGLEDTP
jgi:outer membrane protein assembly factor BamB